MLKITLLIVLLLITTINYISNSQNNSLSYINNQGNYPYPIDLYIGTGGNFWGFAGSPIGAQVPYGLARIQPDTNNLLNIWFFIQHTSGYRYDDGYIVAISHTHTVGAGMPDAGWIGVMPISLNQNEDFSFQLLQMVKNKRNDFRSKYSHEKEVALPGYYQVYLESHNINVELTATIHSGVHKYQWTNAQDSKVILFLASYVLGYGSFINIDIGKLGGPICQDASIKINYNDKSIQGWIYAGGYFSSRIGGVKIYFYSQFNNDTNFKKFGIWNEDQLQMGSEEEGQGCAAGAFIEILENKAEFYVGLSFISIEQAKINLYQETQNLFQTFDQVCNVTQQQWLNEIGKVQIESDNIQDMLKFYSAFYHTMQSPTIWSEQNGVYLGFDGKIQQKPDWMDYVYTEFSIWDDYRSDYPLILLHDPKRMLDISNTFLLIYQQSGNLPKWWWMNGEADLMIGSHSNVVLADQIVKKEYDSNFNTTLVTEACLAVANTNQSKGGRWDPIKYQEYQYVPYEYEQVSTSLTLAYAFDDWCIGNIFNALEQEEQAQEFWNRSKWYKNTWSPQEKFFCPRSYKTNTFDCPLIKPDIWDKRYTEGDAWHYRFNVPFDPQGLIELFGSQEYFVEELQKFFEFSEFFQYTAFPNPYYWAGNEEDLFAAYMFSYVGRPDLTQKFVQYALKNWYTDKPNGNPGQDDYGELFSWFAFNALGLYPKSGTTQYVLVSPLFEKIKITRNVLNSEEKCILEIKSENVNSENMYLTNIKINGQNIDLKSPFVDHLNDLSCSKENNQIIIEFQLDSQVNLQ